MPALIASIEFFEECAQRVGKRVIGPETRHGAQESAVFACRDETLDFTRDRRVLLSVWFFHRLSSPFPYSGNSASKARFQFWQGLRARSAGLVNIELNPGHLAFGRGMSCRP
jgi:hypothetical protein